MKHIAELFRRGLSAQEVTDQFAGKRAVWSGVVSEIASGTRLGVIALGVQLDMTPVEVGLPGGRRAKVDYLFLNVRPEDFSLWSKVKLGTRIGFSTEIGRSTGVSPGIRWSELSDNEGVILFSTEKSVPVDNGS